MPEGEKWPDPMSQSIKEIVLERLKLSVRGTILKEMLDDGRMQVEVRQRIEFMVDSWVADLKLILFGKKAVGPSGEIYEHADGWWEAFRERYFPAFWLRKYPIKKKRIDLSMIWYRICPHIDPKADQRQHIFWLADNTWRPDGQ